MSRARAATPAGVVAVTDEMEPVVVPIDGELDLHTFRPGEVSEVVRAYIEACLEEGIDEVRIVHGKGRGALRRGVVALLEKLPEVASYGPAPPERGGWGATLVQLRTPPGAAGD